MQPDTISTGAVDSAWYKRFCHRLGGFGVRWLFVQNYRTACHEQRTSKSGTAAEASVPRESGGLWVLDQGLVLELLQLLDLAVWGYR